MTTSAAHRAPSAPLPRPYMAILYRFYEEGGEGELDRRSGCVTVGPTKCPMPGDAIAWMMLVAAGFVAGERGLVLLTEAGRIEAQGVKDSMVRGG